jgi:hypothetical protein
VVVSVARTQARARDERVLMLETLERDLAIGRRNLEGVLASALAIERDAHLRAAIGAANPNGPTAIALAERGPFVVVEHGQVTSSTMLGADPPGIDAVLSLPDALDLAPGARASFEAALRATGPEAARAIAEISEGAERYPERAFTELQRWAPLLAMHAYRQSVTIQSIFDLERGRARSAATVDELRGYRERVHLLGHLTLLATSAEPAGWLAEMSRAFTWRVWTPSFPLVRERIQRLAVRGGWAAARFGAGVIEPYFARLATGQPMHAFDAALGIVAIASTRSDLRAQIAEELTAILAVRSREADGELYQALSRSARLALESPEVAARQLVGGVAQITARRIAEAVDTDEDPATLDDDGYYRAILAAAGLAGAPAQVFFATTLWN